MGSWCWLMTRGDSVLLPKPAAHLLGSVSYPEVGHFVLLSSSPGPTSVWGYCLLAPSGDSVSWQAPEKAPASPSQCFMQRLNPGWVMGLQDGRRTGQGGDAGERLQAG